MHSRKSPLQALRGSVGVRRRNALLACALLGIGASAEAAEFGRARMLSGLGQPLYVEIPVNEIQDAYTPAHFVLDVSAGQASDGALADTVRFPVDATIRQRAGSNRDLVLVIRSSAPMRRPVVDLEVALRGPEGMQRRRVVLLLPPAVHPSASPITLVQSSASPRSSAPAGAPDSITVRRGDTAGRLAQRLRSRHGYDAATLYQVLAALLQANPSAFINGNMNGLRAGARLKVPDLATVQAIDADEARRLYAQHMRDYRGQRGQAGADAVAGGSSADAASGRIERSEPAPQPPSGRDELRISSGTGAAVGTDNTQTAIDRLQDERAATQRALADAQGRVGEVEANIASMQKLLDAQNATLARLQAQAGSSAGAPGQPGATGSAGAPGAAGVIGATGASGSAGVAGPPGPAGAAGSAGAPGTAGTPGTPGTAGVPGVPGAPGTLGAPGAAGTPDGTPGASGVPGAAGTAGVAGPASAGVQSGPTGQAAAAGAQGGVPAAGAPAGVASTAAPGVSGVQPAGAAAGNPSNASGGSMASSSTSGAAAGPAANTTAGQGAQAGRADPSAAGQQGMASDASASPSWFEAYFWPIAVLVLAFMAIVLAIVFRKRSVPVTEVQGVRRPVPAGTAIPPARNPAPDSPADRQASSEDGRT